ncbi:MAG: L-serine ammonia-lyase, iron-sulfur-dependent, subunit alpha [Synergistaceae bacterium]|nr:L-serine ammonia-lyase, iron-sulfur-dependent, subunit alpha [Synergistaceae bacterium]
MKTASVFNGVLGPVMRGPSSSHTAASYHIGRMARDIFGGTPPRASIRFDENGSYGKVYAEQGSDKAFITGLLDLPLLGDDFHDAREAARRASCDVRFFVGSFPEANHPNWVRIEMSGDSSAHTVTGASIGGGSVVISEVDGRSVDLRGDSWVVMADCVWEREEARGLLAPRGKLEAFELDGGCLLVSQGCEPPDVGTLDGLRKLGLRPRVARPVFFPLRGEPLFGSASELLRCAEGRHVSIGEAALEYERRLLGMERAEAMDEMKRRYAVMKRACERALDGRLDVSMQLLRPTAGKIWEIGKSSPFWGMNVRAAARAMAVMHANGGMDVVCAAPTGGAAGTLPGVVITLEEELGLSEDETCMALWAAGAVGLILDARATFAAEVAGCQVEIGAGGAMASAACVEAAGGTARQTLDAAAISFQNTMGSVCDPVQGIVEIPCHTRNASAAGGAFVNAALAMCGYENGIPLDETIDAVYAVGKMLPPELRCTSLGGLSLCPSALAMKRLR